MSGKVLTKSEIDAKREALFEFVSAAALHKQVLPSMEKVGQMLRISHQRARTMMTELHAAGRICQTVITVRAVGKVRIVRIIATGHETAVRQPVTTIGRAARKLATYDQDKRREGEDRDRQVYGSVLDDVQYLRRRGWVIHREKPGLYRVGNQFCAPADIVAKAQRERRLAGVAQ